MSDDDWREQAYTFDAELELTQADDGMVYVELVGPDISQCVKCSMEELQEAVAAVESN